MNTVKDLLQNNFIKKIIDSLIGKASYMVFMMLFTLICTRLYGVEVFGEYTYAFTIVTIAMFFAKAGMDHGLMYFIPKCGYKHVSFSMLVNFVISIIIIISMFFFTDNNALKLSLPLVWLFSLEQILFGVYRADGEIKKFYLINSFYAFLLRVIFAIVLYFYFSKDVESILFALYASYIFSIIIYVIQLRKKIKKIEFNLGFLKYSLPLLLASFLGVIIDRIDVLMIGNMLDHKSVGIYQVATQISGVLLTILFIFNTVYAPKISQLYHSNKNDEIKKLYIKSTRVLFIIGFTFLLFIIFFKTFILQIFGEELIEGETALLFRVIAQVINVSVGSVWVMLSMTGNPKAQMYVNLLACLVNIVLNYLFIPIYGIDGAGLSTMISIGLANIIGYIMVCNKFKLKVYKYF